MPRTMLAPSDRSKYLPKCSAMASASIVSTLPSLAVTKLGRSMLPIVWTPSNPSHVTKAISSSSAALMLRPYMTYSWSVG